jgi:FAD/FMN-containing dehydrogenase
MRHGMMRAQVIGLEAVLADGTVLSRLGGLIKDNSGFDLKHLFCGTEGTLGVVTRARLALQPAPKLTALALVALPGLRQGQDLLVRMRQGLGSRLSAFEFIERRVYAGVEALGRVRVPLKSGSWDCCLIEVEGANGHDIEDFEQLLVEAQEAGLASHSLLAQSAREQADFWALRDGCSQMILALSDTHGFDIGIGPTKLIEVLAETEATILRRDPDARVWLFGHLGDGNIHFIVTSRQPEAVSDVVHSAIAANDGALSAEHGLGREKAAMLPLIRSVGEIATMRTLKAALDPRSILNPGRVLPPVAP